MDDKARMLSRVPLFERLNGRALSHVERLVDEIDMPAGKALTREGLSGREFFIILDGNVSVSRGGETVATLGPGDFFGEIALLDGGPRTATATTSTPCRLLVLAHREFDSLLAEHVEVRAAVLEALAQRVRRLDPSAE
jgi:CRP/FNR family cyclic AMP-dependent transcriptional regulator